MPLCHLYTLHLFTWSVVHTVLGITGKLACSFGLNWLTTTGLWWLLNMLLFPLSRPTFFFPRTVVFRGDTSMLAGVWGWWKCGVGVSVVRPFTGWRWPQLQGTVSVNNISSGNQRERMCLFPTWSPQGGNTVWEKYTVYKTGTKKSKV